MIAKFFIDRPVLANVLAFLIVIVGFVSLINLPVSQYPNVGSADRSGVQATYFGASAATIARDVALPIEEKVNGVEGMIYMSSTSSSDGIYTLTVTFGIGTDADKAEILVQNRVASALASLPQSVQAQGVQTSKRSTSILEIRRAGRRRWAFRQPVSLQLRDHQPARRRLAHRWGGQRRRLRRRAICDAPVARSAKAAGAQSRSSGCHQCRQSAEPLDQLLASLERRRCRPAPTSSIPRSTVPSKLSRRFQISRISSSRAPTPAAVRQRACATLPASNSVRSNIVRASS